MKDEELRMKCEELCMKDEEMLIKAEKLGLQDEELSMEPLSSRLKKYSKA